MAYVLRSPLRRSHVVKLLKDGEWHYVFAIVRKCKELITPEYASWLYIHRCTNGQYNHDVRSEATRASHPVEVQVAKGRLATVNIIIARMKVDKLAEVDGPKGGNRRIRLIPRSGG